MNEKRFYHAALDRTLLGGMSVKKQIDAKIRAGRADASRQKSVRTASRNTQEWNPRPIPWIAIPVAAMLLLCTLTIGITAGARALRDSKQAASATPMPTATPAPVHAVSAAAHPDIGLKDLGCTVKLLPEFDDALKQECLDWRTSQGGEPYREEDWAWLRNTVMTITELEQSGSRFQWTVDTVSDPLQPFLEMSTVAEGQAVELSLDSVTYTVEGDETVHSLGSAFNQTDWKPGSDRFSTTWCNERTTSDAPLPAKGVVTMTAAYCVVDFKVEDMGRRFGSVALIEHTFSYDAEKLNQAYAVPQVQTKKGQRLLWDESVRVRYVTELDNPQQYHTFASFRKEDWAWLEQLQLKTDWLMYQNDELSWLATFDTDHIKTLTGKFDSAIQAATGQCADLWLDGLAYEYGGEHRDISGWIDEPPIGVIGTEPMGWTEEESYFAKNIWPEEHFISLARHSDMPTSGEVTMIETYRVIDYNVDVQSNIATVALIEHRYTFDASAIFSGKLYQGPIDPTSDANEAYRVLLATETDNAERYASARKAANLPALNPTDWEWLRSIEPTLDTMQYDGAELTWMEHLQTADNQAFTAEGDGNLRLSIQTESITFRAAHNTVSAVAYGDSAANLAENGDVIVASYEGSFFSNGNLANMLWQDRAQTVTTTYRVIDQSALTDGVRLEAAVVATIEHTFTVDKNELLQNYGLQPKQIVELGVRDDSLPGMTIELSAIYTGSTLSVVLQVHGSTELPRTLTLDSVAFRTAGRPAISASIINNWSFVDSQHATTTVFFPIDQNPIWPGNTLIVEGTLNGEAFTLSYTYPSSSFKEWNTNVKAASDEALAAKEKVRLIESTGSLVQARSGFGYQNVVVSHVLREGNVLYVLTAKEQADTTGNFTELLYSDFDEGFWPMIDGRPCDYAALVAQDDSLTNGFAYCVMLPYSSDRLPEESLIGFEGAMFRYNWRTGEATVPNSYEEYLAMRKESYELAKPYCTADWIWRFRAEADGFAVTDLVFHNKTMNGVIGLVLEETVNREMENLFDPREAPVVTLDGTELTFNADANTLDPSLGNLSKDGKRCGYCYFGFATADLPDSFPLTVTWRGKTTSVTLNKSDVIRLPAGDDRSYHDVLGY